VKNLEDSRPLAESLSQSQILGVAPIRSSRIAEDQMMFSEFDKVSHADFDRDDQFNFNDIKRGMTINTINPQSKRIGHEIACGSDSAMDKAVEIGTDVNNLIEKTHVGSNTARVQTKDQIIDTHVAVKSSGVQA